MYGCESWAMNRVEELMFLNCGAGEDSWESLGQQGDHPVNPKENQPWIFIGRTDAEAETPILVKNWLIWKDPDAGKDWRQEETGMTEDMTFGWHHQVNGHECEQAPGVGDGQGGLVCPLGCKESDTTDWPELKHILTIQPSSNHTPGRLSQWN